MTKHPKKLARELVTNHLGSITAEKYTESNLKVNEYLAKVLKKYENRRVLLYMPIKGNHEVDVTALREVLPTIVFDTAPTAPNGPFPDGSYDVVVVPLLGFDDDGYRLGHGGGWYDKFLLSQPSAIRIGVGLEAGRIEFLTEAHDIPMDVVITENGIKSKR